MDQLTLPRIEEDIIATQLRKQIQELKQTHQRMEEILEAFERRDITPIEVKDYLKRVRR